MPTIKPVSSAERAQRAAPGLLRADVAAELPTAKKSSTGERRHVVDLRREKNVEQIAVSVGGVGQKRQMPEHPADVDKSHDGERHALKLALNPVSQNRDQQDQRHRIDREGDEQSVPAPTRFLALRL
jgi:hypothetical protein